MPLAVVTEDMTILLGSFLTTKIFFGMDESMLRDFHMTLEQFEDLPKFQQTDIQLGTLFIFRMFDDLGLCVIEEMNDKELSFRVIAAMKRFSLSIDTSHKLLIPAFLQPPALYSPRLYVKS